MKISILYDVAYPFVKGGGQKRLFEVARRLVCKGHQVEWWALRSWPDGDQTSVEGVRFHAVGPMVPMYARSGRRSIVQALHYAKCILRHRKCFQADRVHCGVFPTLHLFVALACTPQAERRLSVDWWEVWGDHWLEYLGPSGIVGRAVERSLIRRIRNLVAVSPQGEKQLRALAGEGANVQLIHNAIDYQGIQRAPAMTGGSYDLAYLGRLKNHKNVDILIRALAEMKRLGVPARLEIIGDGPERSRLEQLALDLEVRQQITFHGEIKDEAETYGWLKSAKLFVNPSTKEGGGSITAFEANACGLPVVAFRHPLGVDPDLIEEGRTGFWVDEFTPDALARRLCDILAHPDALKEINELCRRSAEVYDWSYATELYERFFLGYAAAGA